MPLPTSRRAETSRLHNTVSASRRRRKVDPKERFSLRGYGHRATVNTVYVLGAGFSRAVSSKMPLLTDLTSNLRETHSSYFDDVDTPVIRNNVESLLTFLATPQPWLKREQQLVNLSRFHGLAHAIADLIGEREDKTLDSPAPDWLIALVELWGSEQATVITLNYDVLVEKAVCSGQPKKTKSAGFTSLYAVPATPLHRRAAPLVPGSEEIDLFELLRPHGCINWRYSGRESFYGEQIYQEPRCPNWEPDRSSLHRDYGRDKRPLIVPPTLVKTGFFNGEFIEVQWSRAAAALLKADRVFFLGYSLPATDMMFQHLLATTTRRSADVVIADLDWQVAGRYEAVFSDVDLELVGVPDPIPKLVDRLRP